MSLSIGLGRFATGLALPRLPEIKVRIPNPFALQTPSQSSTSSSSTQGKSLKQRLEEYLEGREVEDSFFIDNGILKAAPKQKVSPQKRKQKLYGPGRKQLKYLHHLNRCPSCGHFKRANTLCMHCVSEIQKVWRRDYHEKNPTEIIEQDLDELDRRILYPGKVESEYSKQLKRKDEYLPRRLRSLPVERKNEEIKDELELESKSKSDK